MALLRQCSRCHRFIGVDKDKPNPGHTVKATHGFCKRCYYLQHRENMLDVQSRHPELHLNIPREEDAPPESGEAQEFDEHGRPI